MLIACKSCHRQYDVEGMAAGESVRCRCGEQVTVPKARRREARVLHCSGCGGKLRDQARKCDYCGAEITVAERNVGPACPECYAQMPVGARFCGHCGVKIAPEAIRATSASASCPRCKGRLALLEFAKGHYTECTSCGGIWLDAKTFDTVVEEKDRTAFSALFPAAACRETPAEPSVELVKYVPCPTCGSLMHRKNFGGCSGVIIDWCKGHGYWFDPRELEKVMAFIASGGLDKARMLELERQKGELERMASAKKAMAGAHVTMVRGGWEPPSFSVGHGFGNVAAGLVKAFLDLF